MRKALYIESYAGISGDMFVAAMLDLGASEEKLKAVLSSLPLSGYEVVISRRMKSGIDVCDFDVRVDAEHENHDHDMHYLYGHLEGNHDHGHDGDDHTHTHAQDVVEGEHHHDHEHHHHHHAHRGLREVTDIINAGTMTDGARALALRIFDILAEAEAKAHHATKETVHFHEVGAVDSIVDIVAAAVCFDDLSIGDVILPSLTEGVGTVRCAHGILPVPVSAVAAIVAAHNVPLSIMQLTGEFVTPTGAAIAAAIMTETKLPQTFVTKRVGIGGGKREYERPSMLRVMEIEIVDAPEVDEHTVVKIESDIDDLPAEELGYVMDRLYAAGAREVHFVPIYMKKNRPGIELVLLCDKKDIARMEEILFTETTTIGVRRTTMERHVLPREAGETDTPYGTIRTKVVTLPDGRKRTYPEYESMKAAAAEKGVALRDVRVSCMMASDDA